MAISSSLKMMFVLLVAIATIRDTSPHNASDDGNENSIEKEDTSEDEMDVEEDFEAEWALLMEAASRGDVSVLADVSEKVCGDLDLDRDLNLEECPPMTALLRKRDGGGRTALHRAAKEGRADAVKFLLRNGALADAQEYLLPGSPVRLACVSGQSVVMENPDNPLKELTANLRDASGETALELAVHAGHLDVVKILTPFSDAFAIGDSVVSAAEKGNIKIVNSILQSGVCLEKEKLRKTLATLWQDLQSDMNFILTQMSPLLNQ